MKKIIPKILSSLFLLLIIAQTGLFLFYSLFYTPVSAENSVPYMQINIPTVHFSSAAECTGDSSKICVNWIGEYIGGIYKYAVGIVGIVAATIIAWGGISYLIAGGSADKVSNAKSWISAALFGLILVISSYMLLGIVNSDLVAFGKIGVKKTDPTKSATTSTQSSSEVCKKFKTTKNTINFPSAISGSLNTSSSCNNYSFSGYGVNEKLLRAIAMTESTCRSSITSGAGACGIMQLLPTTANKSCEWLNNNPQDSIAIAAQYILDNNSKHKNDRKKIFAGYNSGYSTTADPNTGKKGALAPSSDCSGSLAYECCINAGELNETQDYVVKASKYYNGY